MVKVKRLLFVIVFFVCIGISRDLSACLSFLNRCFYYVFCCCCCSERLNSDSLERLSEYWIGVSDSTSECFICYDSPSKDGPRQMFNRCHKGHSVHTQCLRDYLRRIRGVGNGKSSFLNGCGGCVREHFSEAVTMCSAKEAKAEVEDADD